MLVKVSQLPAALVDVGSVSSLAFGAALSVLLQGLEYRPCLYNTLSCPKVFLAFSSQAVSYGRPLKLDVLHGNGEKNSFIWRETQQVVCAA